MARGEGVPMWVGNCLPIADGLVPYAPIGAILRAMTRELGPDRMRALAGPAAQRLAPLVPELTDDAPAEPGVEAAAVPASLLPALLAL